LRELKGGHCFGNGINNPLAEVERDRALLRAYTKTPITKGLPLRRESHSLDGSMPP
jgi:hypothetical protein